MLEDIKEQETKTKSEDCEGSDKPRNGEGEQGVVSWALTAPVGSWRRGRERLALSSHPLLGRRSWRHEGRQR